ERSGQRRGVGQVQGETQKTRLVVQRLDRRVAVEADHRGAALEKRGDARLADARRCAGDERDLAAEDRRRARLAELRLLEVPVFDVEEVFLADSAPAAERLGAQDDVDRVVVE